MRKNFWLVVPVILLAAALFFPGCGRQEAALPQEDPRIVIYTSFYPLYDFAGKIGGERVQVNKLVPAGSEPHDWEPGPRDMAALSDADLLIVNGLGMEPWLETLAANLPSSVTVIDTSAGITPLTGAKHKHEEEEGHEEEHKHEEYKHEEEAAVPDPHIWLDPWLALHQAELIYQGLIALDPEYTDYYTENLAAFRREVEKLDAELTRAFANVRQNHFIVTHWSFAYLAERYGLEQTGISGLSPHNEPSPAQLKEIVDIARKYNIRHIFQEPLASPRLATVLAEEIGAVILEINPLESLTPQELAAGEDYFSVMRKNMEQLRIALAE